MTNGQKIVRNQLVKPKNDEYIPCSLTDDQIRRIREAVLRLPFEKQAEWIMSPGGIGRL